MSMRANTATNKKTIKTTLSAASQKILKKLLFTIAKQEQQIELQRQFLASNELMEPYSLFQRIDRGEDSFITSVEILNFLRDNGIHNITEADCYYLVKFFDSDVDGRLNYPDFMQLVLPCDNPALRAAATQRPNAYITPHDYLTLDVERDLTKLFLGEIELHKKSERLKQLLESALDFTEEGSYSAVDDWGYGYIDTRNLHSFFRNHKYKATEEDCVAIVRRMDLDADSKLNKEEFLAGIKPQEPYSKMIVREREGKKGELSRIKKQNAIDVSKGKRVNRKAEEGKIDDPVKTQALDRSYNEQLSRSPLKKRVAIPLIEGEIREHHGTIVNRSINEVTIIEGNLKMSTPNKKKFSTAKSGQSQFQTTTTKTRSINTAGSFKTPQRNGGLDSKIDFGSVKEEPTHQAYTNTQMEVAIVNLFREQLELEKILERAKIDLTLRTDFNLIDAFRIFDSEGKGWVTPHELKQVLTQFNIYANLDDLHLYFSRYDKDDDGKLRYTEFCDSFIPNDAFHASLLVKKGPLHMYHMQMNQQQKERIFYEETREMFVKCWNIHLQNEAEAEKIRLQFNAKNGGFSHYQCFQAIDSKGDGFVDKEEIKELLIKYNLYVSEKEICALIDRYDRKRDGLITFSEFTQELTSKTLSPAKSQSPQRR